MTITYRTDGDWGSGKGSPLTSEEVDENFWTIWQDLLDFHTYLPTSQAEIVNVTLVGTQLTFFMSDDTTWGPFTIPSNTQYQATEIITETTVLRSLILSDSQKYIRCTNVAGCSISIPANSSVAFPIKTEIHFRQANASGIVFTPVVGVTLNGIEGYDNFTVKEGAVATLKKVDDDEWDLFGLLSPEAVSS